MDVNAVRLWGIAASAVVMAVALAFALEPASNAAPQGVYETTQAPPATAVSFVVAFRGNGPIARSQAAAVRGQTAPAQREIEVQLIRQTAFAGLCFDRFTVGAAEVVLRTCEPVLAAARERTAAEWLQRLRAMRAVAYADANTTATPGRAG
jgi:hypothetical protein